MMMRKFFLAVIIVLVPVTIITEVFLVLNIKAYKLEIQRLQVVDQQNYSIKLCLVESFQNNLRGIKDVLVSDGLKNDNVTSLFNEVKLPCLVVYIPFSQDACMSCVDYAIDRVKAFFPDFTSNSQIILITSKLNPNIKSRVTEKTIYHLCSSDNGFSIEKKSDMDILPSYFVIGENYKLNFFFTPNILYPDLVNEYLVNVKVVLNEKKKLK